MNDAQPGRFTITRLRPGYAKAEVDKFVARIEATLAGWTPQGGPVTAEEVRGVLFATTRLRPGYDQREVDQALDGYAADLAARDR